MLESNGEMTNRSAHMGWILGKGTAWQSNEWKIVANSAHWNTTRGECDWALYNILDDEFEMNNVTEKNAQVFEAMMSEFKQWEQSVLDSQMNESGCGVKNPYKDKDASFFD